MNDLPPLPQPALVRPNATTRIARADDADAAVRVLVQSITHLCVADHRNDPDTLREWLGNKTVENFRDWARSTENFCVVTEWDDQVSAVGVINRRGEVKLCYVSPEAVRHGCGTATLRALEEQAVAWRVKKVQLVSTVSARAFYERQGYVSAGKARQGFGLSRCYPYEKKL